MLKKKAINLGCGSTEYLISTADQEWINIDKSNEVKCDLLLDITQGLPFDDNVIDQIHSGCCLEQLLPEQFMFVLNECHRILKEGCQLDGYVPSTDPRVLHLDPMDRMFFQPDSFRYLLAGDVHYERFGKNYGFKSWQSCTTDLRDNGIIYFILLK